MKKLVLLFAAVCLYGSAALAQREYNSGMGDGQMPERLNAVKLNLSGLAYNNIALQYERALAPKISVACQLRYTLKGGLPFSNTLSSANSSSDSLNVFGTAKMGGWAVTPEFRFYPRHVMKGFYLAPYLRFRGISLDYPISYTDDNNVSQKVTATGNFTSFGGGLMIGSHFNLGKAISLDWFIIGFQYMMTNGSFKATTTQALSSNDQQEIRNDLEEIKSDVGNFLKDFSYSVNSNSLSINSKFGMIGLRGFGINLGYRF